jgi:hypothetical protein
MSIVDSITIDNRSSIVIKVFNSYIKNITIDNNLNNLELLLTIATRNPLSNQLLDLVSKLDFLQEKIQQGCDFSCIVVDTHEIAYTVKSLLDLNGIHGVEVKTKENFQFKILKLIYRVVKNAYFLLNDFIWSRFFLLKIIPTQSVIFVDTFALPNSFSTNHTFIDRYYTGYESYYKSSDLQNFWYAPTINGIRTPFEYFKMFKNLKYTQSNFLIQEAWLTSFDYFKIFILSLSLPLKCKIFKLNNSKYDFSKVIDRMLFEDIGSYELSKSIAKYFFIRRLKKSGIKFISVVDWNENQNIDRALNLAFHKYYKNITINGYQGYFSSNYETHKHPQPYEVALKTIPDKLHVIYKYDQERKRRICDKINIKLSTPFRFSYLNNIKDAPLSYNDKTMVLVALPIMIKDSREMINMCIKLSSITEYNIRFLLKHHPVHDFDQFYKKIPESSNRIFIKESGRFDILLKQSYLIFSYSSSVCIEALSLGIPVAVFGSRNGITNNLIPENFSANAWRVVYSCEQLFVFIKYINKIIISREDKIFSETQFSVKSAKNVFSN